jgi:predicted transcriptional regulator
MSHALDALGRRERQIVEILIRRGQATAAEVLADLPDPPSYSAVRGMLRCSRTRGTCATIGRGPRHVYHPTQDAKEAGRAAARHLVRTFFNGSMESAVAAMLGATEKPPSAEELDRLGAADRARPPSQGRSSMSPVLASVVLGLLVKLTAVLAAGAALAALLRRRPAAARHEVWSLTLLAALALAPARRARPCHPAPPPRPGAGHGRGTRPLAGRRPGRDPGGETTVLALHTLPQQGAADSEIPRSPGSLPLSTLLLVAWALGIALIVVRSAVGYLALRRLARTATVLDSGDWPALLAETCTLSGAPSAVRPPAQRRRRHAAHLGHAAPDDRPPRRLGIVAARAAPGRAAPRAGARRAPRCAGAARRHRRLRPVLVPPRSVDGPAPPAPRGRARLRRPRSRERHASRGVRGAAPRGRAERARPPPRRLGGGHRDGTPLHAGRTAPLRARRERALAGRRPAPHASRPRSPSPPSSCPWRG